MKILIIDDSRLCRAVLTAYLAPYDVDLAEAECGEEALQMLRDDKKDLVILDYGLPGISGKEVLDLILQDEDLEKVPVIVYTAGGFDKETENWLKSSSTLYLEKSNLGDDLIPAIESLFGDRLQLKE